MEELYEVCGFVEAELAADRPDGVVGEGEAPFRFEHDAGDDYLFGGDISSRVTCSVEGPRRRAEVAGVWRHEVPALETGVDDTTRTVPKSPSQASWATIPLRHRQLNVNQNQHPPDPSTRPTNHRVGPRRRATPNTAPRKPRHATRVHE